jgi:hypothetical protein
MSGDKNKPDPGRGPLAPDTATETDAVPDKVKTATADGDDSTAVDEAPVPPADNSGVSPSGDGVKPGGGDPVHPGGGGVHPGNGGVH